MKPIFKTILQYIVGITLLFSSIPMFLEGGKGIIGSLFLFIGGIFCIPKFRTIIENSLNYYFNRATKYLIVIISWFSVGIFSKPANTLPKTTTTNKIKSAPQIKIHDSIGDTFNNGEKVISSRKIITSTPYQLNKKIQNKPHSSSKLITTNKRNKIYSLKRKSQSNRHGYGRSYTSGKSGYILGPRGGCYYINSNGRKVYVDHSYCY